MAFSIYTVFVFELSSSFTALIKIFLSVCSVSINSLGDGGNNLSGGEKQRIAIARAILKDSPIIVLDEATAFTDPENEAVIQRSIGELVAGKTLIVIAHRLSTITMADKIIVMNHGRIEAEGSHQALLESCELYRSLWNAHISVSDKKEEAV